MQPRKVALACASLIAPCLLVGCSQSAPTPPTSIPNPAFPPADVIDGKTITTYRDVADIADAQRRKNEATNPHMTLADFEASKLLDILDQATTAQTILAVRDDLAYIRDFNATVARKPRPRKKPEDKKRKFIFDSYTKWMKIAADIKAVQFNVRTIDRSSLPVESIVLRPHPPTYEQAKKQALFYARQIPVHPARTSTP